MSGFAMSPEGKRVPRQGWPRPQKLDEIGDKQTVLEFLMDEYLAIRDFQSHDAIVLVAYLTGDNAARREAVLDALRNEAAMKALEELWRLLHSGCAYDSDVVKYQALYDAIGDLADRTAEGQMKHLEKVRLKNEPRAEPQVAPVRTRGSAEKKHTVKVEPGQTWKHVWAEKHPLIGYHDRPLTVAKIQSRPSVNGHDFAVFEDEVERCMWLDDNGYPDSPGDWEFVGVPGSVAVGQYWQRRVNGAVSEGTVSSVDRERLSAYVSVEAGLLLRMKLDAHLRCAEPDAWMPIVVVPGMFGERKVQKGQYWRFRTSGRSGAVLEEPHVGTASAVPLGCPDGGALPLMTVDKEGLCSKEYWEYIGEPGPSELPQPAVQRHKVEKGQLWRLKGSEATSKPLGRVTSEPRGVEGETLRIDFGGQGNYGSMTVDRQGYCLREGTAWEYVGEAPKADPDLERHKVERGQIWYQNMTGGGRRGRVISLPRVDRFHGGRHVALEGHVENFVMLLDENDFPRCPEEWKLLER